MLAHRSLKGPNGKNSISVKQMIGKMSFLTIHKSRALTLFLLFIAHLSGFTQGVVVTGKVSEKENGEPLMGATVSLQRQIDTILISGTVTDTVGMFQLRSVPKGNYLLEVSFIGFYPLKRTIKVTQESLDLGNLLLEPSEILLGEVSVTTRKSALVNELDKKVYNVQEDILAESGSVSDI
jgi:hypothetical protein